jgi:hypothetical protein
LFTLTRSLQPNASSNRHLNITILETVLELFVSTSCDAVCGITSSIRVFSELVTDCFLRFHIETGIDFDFNQLIDFWRFTKALQLLTVNCDDGRQHVDFGRSRILVHQVDVKVDLQSTVTRQMSFNRPSRITASQFNIDRKLLASHANLLGPQSLFLVRSSIDC